MLSKKEEYWYSVIWFIFQKKSLNLFLSSIIIDFSFEGKQSREVSYISNRAAAFLIHDLFNK